jgi:hypothetical protein
VDLLRRGKKICQTTNLLPEDNFDAAVVTFSPSFELVFIGAYIFQTHVVREPLSLPLPLLREVHRNDVHVASAFSACGHFFAAQAPGINGLALFRIEIQRSAVKRCDIGAVGDRATARWGFTFHPHRCQLLLYCIEGVKIGDPDA